MDDYRQYIKFKGRGKTLRPHVRKILRKIPMDKLTEEQTRALTVEGPGHILGDTIHVIEIIDPIEGVSTAENVERAKPVAIGENIVRLKNECRCGRHYSYRKLAKATGIDFALVCRHAKGKVQPRVEILGVYAQAFSKCQGRKITIAELECPLTESK